MIRFTQRVISIFTRTLTRASAFAMAHADRTEFEKIIFQLFKVLPLLSMYSFISENVKKNFFSL